MNNAVQKIESMNDLESIISSVVFETPLNVPVNITAVATAVMDALNTQYGRDSSHVRVMLSFRKVTDMVRGYCRSQFDPKEQVDKQIAFTEFGDDIQPRYPVKIKTASGDSETEYHSPMAAPVEQLLWHVNMMRKRSQTEQRRSDALEAFIHKYRSADL